MASADQWSEVLYGQAQVPLPRVAIKFCVQCKWNLRAAYYAQELLSTFSTTLGEVSLIPATGGLFTITLQQNDQQGEVILWDRKTEGGFPETKELKGRVRDRIQPGRGLGHIDRSLNKSTTRQNEGATAPLATAAEGQTIKLDGREIPYAKAIVEHEHEHTGDARCKDCA